MRVPMSHGRSYRRLFDETNPSHPATDLHQAARGRGHARGRSHSRPGRPATRRAKSARDQRSIDGRPTHPNTYLLKRPHKTCSIALISYLLDITAVLMIVLRVVPGTSPFLVVDSVILHGDAEAIWISAAGNCAAADKCICPRRCELHEIRELRTIMCAHWNPPDYNRGANWNDVKSSLSRVTICYDGRNSRSIL